MGKDILMQNEVLKPVLLRRLFELACCYGGQVVSYQKLLGQLQDSGNVTTLAHYQSLLSQALLLKGLDRYTGSAVRQRASSPKWIPLNTALMTALSSHGPLSFQPGSPEWGRLVEVAVGAHLVNQNRTSMSVWYWREGGKEVDFVVEKEGHCLALEVKSGLDDHQSPGMYAFSEKYPGTKMLKIGGDGLPLEMFFEMSPEMLFHL